jgi:BMFP domain-containing protein YqiC
VVLNVDEESKELFSAILDEIDLVKRENRILREEIANTRLQLNELLRDFEVLASEIRILSSRNQENEIFYASRDEKNESG